LAVAVGLVYRTGDRIGALAQSAVGDHRNCALQFRLEEKPISLEEAARRYGAWYRALEREPAAELITDAGPARVLERHACIYRGRRFAHVVLRYRNERVSLLVAAAPGAGRAADAVGQLPPITSGAVVDGMSVVSFASPNHVVFVVGNVPAQELAALARALAETIPRQLSSV
jgi:hypothetical protein